MARIDLLNKFVTTDPIDVSHVTIDTIPDDYNGKLVAEFQALKNYHNVLDYKVEIKSDPGDQYVEIIPIDSGSNNWDEGTKTFLKLLKYAPVPEDKEVVGRRLALLLTKDVLVNKPPLARTNWKLAWSRMCKTGIRRPGQNKKEMAEVIFVWEHDDYPNFVASCWKW